MFTIGKHIVSLPKKRLINKFHTYNVEIMNRRLRHHFAKLNHKAYCHYKSLTMISDPVLLLSRFFVFCPLLAMPYF